MRTHVTMRRSVPLLRIRVLAVVATAAALVGMVPVVSGASAAGLPTATLPFQQQSQQGGEPQEGGVEEPSEDPEPKTSVTRHQVEIAGQTVRYTATAGWLILKNDEEEPIARFGYTAYEREGVEDPSNRPVTFAYNGGPGSSSIWLHMGALGPRRIETTDADFTPPPPYRLVDNAHSILDVTDLVMIDPVGTGYSRPVGDAKNEDFWGVDQDIESVSRFIKQYVSANGRWNSPKYLLGESYGTMRSAGVVHHLQNTESMAFNGVILVSSFLDARTAIDVIPNDLAHVLFLPTFAASAWYHDALDEKPPQLEPFLEEVESFTMGPYADALMQGDDLDPERRREIIGSMARYTGLSEDYIERADLRVEQAQFTKELLRDEGETVGRLDSRFLGPSFDLLGEQASYDPQSAAVSSAFTSAFLSYYHDELEFGRELNYEVSASVFPQWDFTHEMPGSSFPVPALPNTGPDLARAMGQNPHLEVLVLNGYYDLATPHLATEYTVDHLNLAPEVRENVHMKYYQAGHMMYLRPASLENFRADVVEFIRRTDRL